MDTLYEPPYSLPFQKLVKVRATAINSYGKSLKPSDSNTAGVEIKRRPDKMDLLSEVISTENTIEVSWSEL